MNNRINSTRFLGQDELASQLLELDLGEEQYPMGGIPLLARGNKVYVDATDSHTIIFGATGSKKTRMFAMPSIGIFARAGESFVVTDPKGELFQRTAKEVANQGYEIYCLNLRDLSAGKSWNPLSLPYRLYHSGEKAKAMELVNELAVLMTDEESNAEKFWIYTTVDVLSGLIFYLFEIEEEVNCTLLGLNKLWKSYTDGRRRFLEQVKSKFGGTMIMNKFSPLDNSSDKTVGSIEAVVSMALNRIMINEEMITYLSKNSIRLEELAEKKAAIYLVVPDENKTYHFIVSLFLEQLYEVLIKKAQSCPENTLGIRMNFLIDEFANIPKLENMDSMITASRSRNIRFHLIIQSMKQLRHKYEEYADVICSNCNNWIYLYSKEYELLQEISRLCGEVIYDNGIRVPLFSEFDLQHLDKEKGEALVLSGRNYPCISNLKDIDEYPFAKGREVFYEEPEPVAEELEPVEEEPEPVAEEPESVAEESKPVAEGPESVSEESEPVAEEPELVVKKNEESQAEQGEKTVKMVGLVAVGPDQIILRADCVRKTGINNARLTQMKGLRAVYDIPEESITWYTVSEEMIAEYEHRRVELKYGFQLLTQFPDYTFELECKATNPMAEVGKFRCQLWSIEGEEVQQWLSEEVPDYGGEFGVYYARRMLLRRAKEKLIHTPYTSLRWKLQEKKETGVRVYRKQLDMRHYVDAVLRRVK